MFSAAGHDVPQYYVVYNMACATLGGLERAIRNIWPLEHDVRNILEFRTGRSHHLGV